MLAIPLKREDTKLVGYLSRDEIEALLAAPDRSHWGGRRDHALLLTMYNSGARVSEVTTLRREQVCFGATTFLDDSGNNTHATCSASACHSAGEKARVDFAPRFDGINDVLAGPLPVGVAVDNMTLSSWERWQGATQATSDPGHLGNTGNTGNPGHLATQSP